MSPVLLKATLEVVNRDVCKEIISNSRPTAVIDSSVICAGGDGVHDTCQVRGICILLVQGSMLHRRKEREKKKHEKFKAF